MRRVDSDVQIVLMIGQIVRLFERVFSDLCLVTF